MSCDEHRKIRDLFDMVKIVLWFLEHLVLFDTFSLSVSINIDSPLSHQLLSSIMKGMQPLLSLFCSVDIQNCFRKP